MDHIKIFVKDLFFNIHLFILIGGQLFYNIVFGLPCINMNLPQAYTCSPSWTPLPPPSPYHPSGSSQCTSPKHPVSALNLDWRFVSYVILYMFQCHSPKSSHPLLLPQSPKVSLLLSHKQGYHYHLSKFHIYVLVYCIGVFLSGLLHSVWSAPVSSTSLELIQMYSF